MLARVLLVSRPPRCVPAAEARRRTGSIPDEITPLYYCGRTQPFNPEEAYAMPAASEHAASPGHVMGFHEGWRKATDQLAELVASL